MMDRLELRERLLYKPEYGEFVWIKSGSNKVPDGSIAGYISTTNNGMKYRIIRFNNKNYHAHRLAWFYMYGLWPNVIDHIDGNGVNNKLWNLRNVTTAINHQNSRQRYDNTSGTTGVSWNKRKEKWQAEICANGKRDFLGYFSDKCDAIAVRMDAQVRHGFSKRHGCLEQLGEDSE